MINKWKRRAYEQRDLNCDLENEIVNLRSELNTIISISKKDSTVKEILDLKMEIEKANGAPKRLYISQSKMQSMKELFLTHMTVKDEDPRGGITTLFGLKVIYSQQHELRVE